MVYVPNVKGICLPTQDLWQCIFYRWEPLIGRSQSCIHQPSRLMYLWESTLELCNLCNKNTEKKNHTKSNKTWPSCILNINMDDIIMWLICQNSEATSIKVKQTHRVPATLVLTWVLFSGRRRARPKSATFGWYSLSSNIFPGFMSLCIMQWWNSSCKYAIPRAEPRIMLNIFFQSKVSLLLSVLELREGDVKCCL